MSAAPLKYPLKYAFELRARNKAVKSEFKSFMHFIGNFLFKKTQKNFFQKIAFFKIQNFAFFSSFG